MLALSSMQATRSQTKWGNAPAFFPFHSVHLHGWKGDYEELIDVALAKRDVKAAAFWYKSAKELSPLPTEEALL